MKRIPKNENPGKLEYYIKNFPNLSSEEHKEKLRLYKRSCNWRYIEYYERLNPDKTREECDKLRLYALNCNKPTKIEYYNKNYPDLSESEREEMLNKYLENKKKKPEDSEKHWEYYKKRNPELSKDECLLKAKLFKKSCNVKNIEYYERFYPELSKEEQQQMLKEKLESSKKNSPLQLIYWQNKYPELTEEEQKEKFEDYKKSVCKFNIKYWQTKYPNLSSEEQEKLHNEWVQRYKDNFPKMTGEKNGMHRSHRTEQQLKENCPWAIEFYQKRYPDLSLEEQENLRQEIINKTKQNTTNNCTLEYYIKKGMSEDEAKEALAERQATCRLDKFIKRYGEEEGFNRWLSRQSKWKSSIQQSFIKRKGIKYIIQSNFAIEAILNICRKLKIEYPEQELPLSTSDNKITFLYDFVYERKIIEFNGDFWHANPNKYSSDWVNPSSKRTAQEIWDREELKRNTALENSYQILYIWESEYKDDPDGTIKKCLEFLKS